MGNTEALDAMMEQAKASAPRDPAMEAVLESLPEAARLAAIPVVEEAQVIAVLDFSGESEIELNFRDGETLSILDVPAPEG